MKDNKYRVTELIGTILDELKPMHKAYWKAYEDYDGEDDNELESIESAYYAIDYIYGLVLQRYHEICEHEAGGGSVNWKRVCEIIMQELHRCELRAHQNQRTEAETVYKAVSKLFSDAWTKEVNRLAHS